MTAAWFDGVTLTIEVGFASNPTVAIGSTTWSDITAYVRGFSTRTGRSSPLDAFQAGTCQFVLDNRSRRFDPNYSAGPYFGNLLPMRRVRIRATYAGVTYAVWHGFVDDWPQSYDIGNIDATVTVNCTDGFGVLAKMRVPESYYALVVAAGTPASWYRCSEQDGTTVFDSSGNSRDGVYTGGPTFNSRVALIVGGNDTALAFTTGQYGTVPNPITAFPFSLEWWMVPTGGGTDRNMVVRSGDDTSGSPYLQAEWSVSGLNTLTIKLTHPTNGNEIDNSAVLDPGSTCHIVAVFNNGTTGPDLYVNGVAASAKNAIGTVTVPLTRFDFGNAPGTVGAGTDGTDVVDEFAIYTYALSGADALAHYQAGITPRQGESSGTRISYLLDLVGWPSADRTVASGISTMQLLTLSNAFVLPLLQAVEASEQGQFYMAADGTVVFRDRRWRFETSAAITSNATYGDGPGELLYRDVQTDGGNSFIVNHVKASRANGPLIEVSDATSIATFFDRTEDITGLQNQSDLEIRDLANWRISRRKNPIQRVTVLSITPRATPAALFPQVLSRAIGERITVKRRPQGIGTALTYTVLIEGIEHSVDPSGGWVTQWFLSSVDSQSPQPVIYDSAVYGVYDANVYGY